MAFKPGDPKPEGSGRQPGQLNKTTADAKAALQEAFEELGGVPSLVQWARRDPHGFYTIWGKLIPKDVKVGGNPDEPVIIQVITGVPKKPDDANPSS